MSSEMSWIAENWARLVVAASSLGTLRFAQMAYGIYRKGRSEDLKTEADGDTNLRDHYAKELQSLRDQITRSGEQHAERAEAMASRHRAAMIAADERFDRAMSAADAREAACQAEVRELRKDVSRLSEELIGLRRILAQTSRSAIVLAGQVPTETIETAAGRAADAIGEFEERMHDAD